MSSDAPTHSPTMRTVGLLHGMSSVATVDYYQRINQRVNDLLGGHERAQLLLASVNFGDIERFVRAQDWDRAGDYLAAKAAGLERAGADFLVCGSNTMHRVAPAIEAATSIPFLHIADVVADAAEAQNIRTVGLLGTLPVMEDAYYRDRLDSHGLVVLTPDRDDRRTVDAIIFDELTRSVFDSGSRNEYLRVMNELADRGAEAVVLGCTEISQLVNADHFDRLPLLDSTALHVEAIVNTALDQVP